METNKVINTTTITAFKIDTSAKASVNPMINESIPAAKDNPVNIISFFKLNIFSSGLTFNDLKIILLPFIFPYKIHRSSNY